MTVMLDSETCFDIMSPKLAKELSLKSDHLPSSLALYLNRTSAKIYDIVLTKLDVLNINDITKT